MESTPGLGSCVANLIALCNITKCFCTHILKSGKKGVKDGPFLFLVSSFTGLTHYSEKAYKLSKLSFAGYGTFKISEQTLR